MPTSSCGACDANGTCSSACSAGRSWPPSCPSFRWRPPMDELRRAYHDRISELRQRTGALVVAAADAVDHLTSALLEGDAEARRDVIGDLDWTLEEPARIEEEVLDILALEAPVGRDLRVVLASLFIAQTAGLCFGLVRTL